MAINEDLQAHVQDHPESPEIVSNIPSDVPSDFQEQALPDYPAEPPQLTFVPDSLAESTRKSSLAMSAGIVFVGSVGFMLLLGWFADLLLGSSPWGIVVGIVLGSAIGFLQFFRITSQILAKPTSETPPRSLMTDQTDDPHA